MYRDELDSMLCDCGKPACEDPVWFHSNCHIEAPTWCTYYDGELTIKCSECGSEIASIAVADQRGVSNIIRRVD